MGKGKNRLLWLGASLLAAMPAVMAESTADPSFMDKLPPGLIVGILIAAGLCYAFYKFVLCRIRV